MAAPTITRTCRSCGNPHEGTALELLEGAQCRRCKAPFRAIVEPVVVDKRTVDAVVATFHIPVLIDVQFFGTPAARSQQLVLERVARKLDGRAVILRLDADDEREACWQLGVLSTPTLVIAKKKQVVFTYEGFADASLVEEWIRIACRL